MKNFIKEFFRKRKERKAQRAESNYGAITIDCIYHDHFIKLMNTVMALNKNIPLPKGTEVFSVESQVKTSVKGESVSLNSSNSLFKQSVLCEIDNKVREYEEKQSQYLHDIDDPHILDFSNIVLKLTLEPMSQAVMDFIKIFKVLNVYLDVQVHVVTDEPDCTFILSGSCRWFKVVKEELIKDKFLADNIIAMKLIDYIDSIIPQYETKNGNNYFAGLEDTIRYIEPYEKLKDKVQVLSCTGQVFEELDLRDYIGNIKDIFSMMQLYLVIDNADHISKAFTMCDLAYKVPDIDRYIIRISFSGVVLFINQLESIKLTDFVKNGIRNNIISTIKYSIPGRVFDDSLYEYHDEYDAVDEIID